MLSDAPARVLDLLGLRPGTITVLKDLPRENGSWLVKRPGAAPFVLRRYYTARPG